VDIRINIDYCDGNYLHVILVCGKSKIKIPSIGVELIDQHAGASCKAGQLTRIAVAE
jgi:hypothetical protein